VPTLPIGAVRVAGTGVAAGVAAAVVAGIALSVAGVARYSALRTVAGVAILWASLLWACVTASRRYGTGSLRQDLGLSWSRWDPVRGLGINLVARIATTTVALVLIGMFGKLAGNTAPVTHEKKHVAALVVLTVVAVVGAPIVEELFFRGLLLRSLASRYGFVQAVAIQAAVFGLAHADPAQGWFTLTLVAVTATFGAIQGLFAREWGLGPLQVSHSLFNLLPTLYAIFR